MKKNLEQSVTLLNGDSIKNKDGKDVTVSDIIVDVLTMPSHDDNHGADGVEKHRRYKLAQRIFDGGDIDLLPEDIVKIKELLGQPSRGLSSLVVGQIYDLLDA